MYKCETCSKLYDTETEASKCENIGIENPLADIGDMVVLFVGCIDDQYEMYESDLRVSNIIQEGHVCVYEFEQKSQDGSWDDAWSFKSYGNEDFSKYYTIEN